MGPSGRVIDGGFGQILNPFVQLEPEQNQTVAFKFGFGGFPCSASVDLSRWNRVNLMDVKITSDLKKADDMFWNGFEDFVDNLGQTQEVLGRVLGVKLSDASAGRI